MEFLVDNYIWIIIAVVVILMTMIGYIAEKTDFGKKEFSKRRKKETKQEQNKKEETKEVPVETVDNTSSIPQNSEPLQEELSAPLVNEQVLEQQMFDDNGGISFEEPTQEDIKVASDPVEPHYEEPKSSIVTEDLNVPLEPTQPYVEQQTVPEEDLNVPFGDDYSVSKGSLETMDNTNEDLSTSILNEDLNAPFGDSEIEKDEFNLELPDIDSIKEDVNTVSNVETEEDDIWKF